MKKGVIFDLDGTLWDSVDGLVASWNALLSVKKYPLVTRAAIESTMGKSTAGFARQIFPYLSEDGGIALLEECRGVLNAYLSEHGAYIYPEMRKTLEALKKKYELFIVSNCHCGYVEIFLSLNNMGEYFTDFEYASRTKKTKAENIIDIMKRNGIDKAVYIGDTESDMLSAGEAGIPFIHAAYGFGKVKEAAASVSSPDKLPDVVSGLL